MSRDDAPLRLVIFDVDGTLLDSQANIVIGMRAAFRQFGRPEPGADAVRRVIGLGLVPAIQGVDAAISHAEAEAIGKAFIDHFEEERADGRGEANSPLFAGAYDALARLAETELLLGVATGKGRRGLEIVLDAHQIRPFFTTTQSANDAPGKPHPGMVENCLAATGVDAAHAVVIGDTTYDIEMARNAGVAALGVDWGSHAADELGAAGASRVLTRFDELEDALAALWGPDAL